MDVAATDTVFAPERRREPVGFAVTVTDADAWVDVDGAPERRRDGTEAVVLNDDVRDGTLLASFLTDTEVTGDTDAFAGTTERGAVLIATGALMV
jgi:hypothetical protein